MSTASTLLTRLRMLGINSSRTIKVLSHYIYINDDPCIARYCYCPSRYVLLPTSSLHTIHHPSPCRGSTLGKAAGDELISHATIYCMLWCILQTIIETCCGERQQHVSMRKNINHIIDDLECLAQDEFDKLYHAYIHARTKKLNLCC